MIAVRDLLKEAVSLGSSDVHLKVDSVPHFRVHSKLIESGFDALDIHNMQSVIDDILPAHLVDQFAKEHEADFSIEEENIGRFRVNIFYAQNAPSVVMRYVKSEIPSFADLNLPDGISEFSDYQRGIIILAGTTGSGKSSTLAAIIGEMNHTSSRRIISLEDPVEYRFIDDKSFISQREVGLDTPSYESALKHVLRQDPDVIMIGEMRDQLTIRTALLAAETGHLVLSTLHSSGSAIAVPRMLDVFPAEEQDQIRMGLASTPLAIICQRLVPSISGGVVPAIEIMKSTPTVIKMLQKNQVGLLYSAIETGEPEGMMTFDQSLYKLIKSGTISEADGLAFATNAEALIMNLKGIFLTDSSRILGS